MMSHLGHQNVQKQPLHVIMLVLAIRSESQNDTSLVVCSFRVTSWNEDKKLYLSSSLGEAETTHLGKSIGSTWLL